MPDRIEIPAAAPDFAPPGPDAGAPAGTAGPIAVLPPPMPMTPIPTLPHPPHVAASLRGVVQIILDAQEVLRKYEVSTVFGLAFTVPDADPAPGPAPAPGPGERVCFGHATLAADFNADFPPAFLAMAMAATERSVGALCRAELGAALKAHRNGTPEEAA